jgi:hypothetical protein
VHLCHLALGWDAEIIVRTRTHGSYFCVGLMSTDSHDALIPFVSAIHPVSNFAHAGTCATNTRRVILHCKHIPIVVSEVLTAAAETLSVLFQVGGHIHGNLAYRNANAHLTSCLGFSHHGPAKIP